MLASGSRRLLPLLSLTLLGAIGTYARAGRDDKPAPAGPPNSPAVRPEGRPSTQPAPIVKVLYVEGYPRWEYRHIRNAMIREKSVRISCLLAGGDGGFAPEGSAADPAAGFSGPTKHFPETAEELALFDVVLFGDLDPRLLEDKQLRLVADFVQKQGGGFGMIAGPRFSPDAYRNTPVASVLPVNFDRVRPEAKDAQFTEGFHPTLTEAGRASAIFRSLRDPDDIHGAMKAATPVLYWYCRGPTVRTAGAEVDASGEVLATHPFDKGADGRPAPLLVVGRSGKGRTLFSAIDDSWRWRFAGGQAAFDEYWVEQFRYLAAGRRATPHPQP